MKQKDVKRIFPELNDYRPEYSQSHLPGAQTAHGGRTCSAGVYMYAAMGRYCSGI